MNTMPTAVRTALWSYDTDKLDITRDKNRIILQTLNHGNEEAIHWLQTTYNKQDLVETIRTSSVGEWSKKSLNYWSQVLNIKPERIGRFL